MGKERTLTCAYEGCDVVFTTTHPTKRFHSKECQVRAGSEGRRIGGQRGSPTPTLEQQLERQREKDLERKRVAELKAVLASENRVRRYTQSIEGALAEFEPTPLVFERKSTKDPVPYHEWAVVLSDWHVGLKARVEETGGLYVQDVSKVRAQVAKLWTALERIHQVESQGRELGTLHILALGDFPDGDDMRASQHRKVEDVFTAQTVQAFDLLSWFIRQALTIFPRVEVEVTGGNHARLGKPGNAGLGELDYIDTMDWLIGAFLERALRSDVDAGRLGIRNWQTFFGYKEILGRKFVFEHGSSFKWNVNSYGGVPWYGVQNLGVKYESMLGGADVVVFGHGHRPALIPNGRGWVVCNGALPATSQFIQSATKSISRPQQWLISVHEDHSETGFVPLYADPDHVLLPGMVWEDPEYYGNLASDTSERVGRVEDFVKR